MTKTGHLPWTFLYDFILQQCSSVNKLVYSHQDGNDNEALFVSLQWQSNLCLAQVEKGDGGARVGVCESAVLLYGFSISKVAAVSVFLCSSTVCNGSMRENFTCWSSPVEQGLEREWQRKQSNYKPGVEWGVRQAYLGGREWLSERGVIWSDLWITRENVQSSTAWCLVSFFLFTGMSEALMNHSNNSKSMYRREKGNLRLNKHLSAAWCLLCRSKARGWKGMGQPQGRGLWSDGVLVGDSIWPKTAVKERAPPSCIHSACVPLLLPCLGPEQPCRQGPKTEINPFIFLVWLVSSWLLQTAESMYGKIFVLNVKQFRSGSSLKAGEANGSRSGRWFCMKPSLWSFPKRSREKSKGWGNCSPIHHYRSTQSCAVIPKCKWV